MFSVLCYVSGVHSQVSKTEPRAAREVSGLEEGHSEGGMDRDLEQEFWLWSVML